MLGNIIENANCSAESLLRCECTCYVIFTRYLSHSRASLFVIVCASAVSLSNCSCGVRGKKYCWAERKERESTIMWEKSYGRDWGIDAALFKMLRKFRKLNWFSQKHFSAYYCHICLLIKQFKLFISMQCSHLFNLVLQLIWIELAMSMHWNFWC